MKKIRFETLEWMIDEQSLTLEAAIKLAFETIDLMYNEIPMLKNRVEKPSIIILNDKEYERPK